jgi:cytochrome c
MDSFEFNKIAAGILVTALLIIGLNQFADFIYHVKKPEKPGYKVEGVVEAKTAGSKGEVKKEEKLADIKVLLASANVAAGENVFKKCAACHTNTNGGAVRIGPPLWGIVGKKAGSHPEFKYSSVLSAHGKNWTFDELNAFLYKPADYIKGTKMAFAGLAKDEDRANVIAYLNSISSSPLPLK